MFSHAIQNQQFASSFRALLTTVPRHGPSPATVPIISLNSDGADSPVIGQTDPTQRRCRGQSKDPTQRRFLGQSTDPNWAYYKVIELWRSRLACDWPDGPYQGRWTRNGSYRIPIVSKYKERGGYKFPGGKKATSQYPPGPRNSKLVPKFSSRRDSQKKNIIIIRIILSPKKKQWKMEDKKKQCTSL